VSPVVLKAMKKGNLKYFVSGERSRALWALLYVKAVKRNALPRYFMPFDSITT